MRVTIIILYQVAYPRLDYSLIWCPSVDHPKIDCVIQDSKATVLIDYQNASQKYSQSNIFSLLSYRPDILTGLPPDSRASRSTPRIGSHTVT